MSLTRADLEQGLMRRLWRDSGQAGQVLSEDELAAGADHALATCPGEPWVFGYGSLIWNPLIEFEERTCATLAGYHRRFCLWSKTGRGTADCPGLVLGLDSGGTCCGVAYRLDPRKAAREFHLLWSREMVTNAYQAQWLPVRTGERTVHALAFVINDGHPNYAKDVPMETLVETISTACGQFGSSREYLVQTVEGLLAAGLDDEFLIELRARVDAVVIQIG